MSCAASPSEMQITVPIPASTASKIASAAKRAGTKIIDVFGARLRDGIGDGVEHRHALDVLAALAGRHAGDELRPVRAVPQPVERPFATRQPLHDELRVLVDDDRH